MIAISINFVNVFIAACFKVCCKLMAGKIDVQVNGQTTGFCCELIISLKESIIIGMKSKILG